MVGLRAGDLATSGLGAGSVPELIGRSVRPGSIHPGNRLSRRCLRQIRSATGTEALTHPRQRYQPWLGLAGPGRAWPGVAWRRLGWLGLARAG